jgi:hypothetical protein
MTLLLKNPLKKTVKLLRFYRPLERVTFFFLAYGFVKYESI